MNITESIQCALEAWGPKATVAGTAAGAGAVGTLGGYQHGQNNWGRGMIKHINNSKGSAPEGSIKAALYGTSNVPKPPTPPGIKIMRSATELSKDAAGGVSKIFKGASNVLNKYRSATS